MKLIARLASCAGVAALAVGGQLATVKIGSAWPDTYSWWRMLGAPTVAILFFASADAAKPIRDGVGAFLVAFILGWLNAIWVTRLMMLDGVPEHWTLGPSAWLNVIAVPLSGVAGAVTAFVAVVQQRQSKALQ